MVASGLRCRPHKCHGEGQMVPATGEATHPCVLTACCKSPTPCGTLGGGHQNSLVEVFLCQQHVAAKCQSWASNLGGRLHGQPSGTPCPQQHCSLYLLDLHAAAPATTGSPFRLLELGSVLGRSWSPSLSTHVVSPPSSLVYDVGHGHRPWGKTTRVPFRASRIAGAGLGLGLPGERHCGWFPR